MALKHTFVSAIADPGDATLVRPSNWNADHLIDSGGVNITSNTSVPTTPATSTIQLFSSSLASKETLSSVDDAGVVINYQASLNQKQIFRWNPIFATATLPPSDGIQFTTPVGTATARASGATAGSVLGAWKRLGLVSAATAGSLCHIRSGATTTGLACFNAGTTMPGDLFYSARFGISDAATVAGARMFVGLAGSTAAASNVEPNTLFTCLGIAQLSTDATQLYMVCGGNTTAQTAVGLGATNFPINNTNAYEISIYCSKVSATVIYYTAKNLTNGVSVSGSFTGTVATIPNGTSTVNGLAVHFWRTNNATALAVGLDIISVYGEV